MSDHADDLAARRVRAEAMGGTEAVESIGSMNGVWRGRDAGGPVGGRSDVT